MRMPAYSRSTWTSMRASSSKANRSEARRRFSNRSKKRSMSVSGSAGCRLPAPSAAGAAPPPPRPRLRRVERPLRAGQGLAVHAQDVADAGEVYPRGEGVQHLLATAGLHAEVGLAALPARGPHGVAVAVAAG